MKHHTDCWRDEGHPACRLARIAILEAEVRRLKGHRAATATGPVMPTWARPADEPPVAE